VELAKGEVTGLRVLGGGIGLDPDKDAVAEVRELHISLTRPFFLRGHQREEMKRAVRDAARAQPPFAASFAAFSDPANDEHTRTFICTEVGVGHQEILSSAFISHLIWHDHNSGDVLDIQLRGLSDALTPTLHSFRQKEYYEQPRFHASFAAWVLLDRPAQNSHSQAPEPLEFLPVSSTPSSGVRKHGLFPHYLAPSGERGPCVKCPAGLAAEVFCGHVRCRRDMYSNLKGRIWLEIIGVMCYFLPCTISRVVST